MFGCDARIAGWVGIVGHEIGPAPAARLGRLLRPPSIEVRRARFGPGGVDGIVIDTRRFHYVVGGETLLLLLALPLAEAGLPLCIAQRHPSVM